MQTFTCPHCDHRYPVKPVLVGRPVRCTPCGDTFVLGSDGLATPYGQDRPRRPASRQSAGPRHHARRQSELRRTLGASLRLAADRAVRRRGPANADHTPWTTAVIGGPRQPAAFRPTLTGEGAREGQGGRRWRRIVAAGLVCLSFAAGILLYPGDGDGARLALAAYGSEVGEDHSDPALELQAMRRRAWLTTGEAQRPLPVMRRIDAAELAAPIRLQGERIDRLRAAFAGLSNHQDLGLMAPTATPVGDWTNPRQRADFLDRHPAAAAHGEIAAGLVEMDLPPVVTRAVALLVAGHHPSHDPLALLRDPDVEALEFRTFHGDGGRVMLAAGNGLRSDAPEPYAGILMRRFHGGSWSRWAILDLTVGAESSARVARLLEQRSEALTALARRDEPRSTPIAAAAVAWTDPD